MFCRRWLACFCCAILSIGGSASDARDAALAIDTGEQLDCQASGCASNLLQTQATSAVAAERRSFTTAGHDVPRRPAAAFVDEQAADSICKRIGRAGIKLTWNQAVAGTFCGIATIAALTWWLAAPASAGQSGGEVAAAAVLGTAGGEASTQVAEKQPRRAHILCLDGLRTIFIAFVVCCHTCRSIKVPLNDFFMHPHPDCLMQFFFPLSGFILCYTGADAAVKKEGGVGHFLARRVVRLAPIFYLVLLCNLTQYYVLGIDSGPVLLAWPLSAFLVQSWVPLQRCGSVLGDNQGLASSAVTIGWFTSTMVALMPLFPLLCRWIVQRPVVPTCWLLGLVVFLRSVPMLFFESELRSIDKELCVYYLPLFRIPEFAAGMVTAMLFRAMSPEHLAWRGWGWVFDAGLASTLGYIFTATGYIFTTDPGTMGDGFCLGPFCLVILAAACSANQGGCGRPASGVLGRLLASWPLPCLAEYSYGAYLVEDVIMHWAPLFLWQHPASNEMKVAMVPVLSFLLSAVFTPTEWACAKLINGRIKGTAKGDVL